MHSLSALAVFLRNRSQSGPLVQGDPGSPQAESYGAHARLVFALSGRAV